MNTTTTMTVGAYAVRMLGAMRALLGAGLRACHTWHQNRNAIHHLRSMSDAELRDIGIARESIEPAVMGGHRDSIRPTSEIF